jgi:hypothetical protein
MAHIKTVHKDPEALLVISSVVLSAAGLLVFAYLGYIGLILGLAAIWTGFHTRQANGDRLWYKTFAVISIVVALVDIAATYFSR